MNIPACAACILVGIYAGFILGVLAVDGRTGERQAGTEDACRQKPTSRMKEDE